MGKEIKISKISDGKKEVLSHKYLIALSVVFLVIASVLSYYAGIYVQNTPGVSAPDLILDHIPTVDLDFLFIYGAIAIVVILFLYPILFKMQELHKVISQFSLLILVRAAFITFTHLSTPAGALKFKIPWIFSFLDFQNDLFFSGHTAIPFLGFLLFKDSKIRWFFLAASIIMAAVVLLMHVHYTIDVLSAFFIAYGTYKIGAWFFEKIKKYGIS
jgi:hypothetical protein